MLLFSFWAPPSVKPFPFVCMRCHRLRLTMTHTHYHRENHHNTATGRVFSPAGRTDRRSWHFCFLAHRVTALSCSHSNCIPTTIPPVGVTKQKPVIFFVSRYTTAMYYSEGDGTSSCCGRSDHSLLDVLSIKLGRFGPWLTA